MAVGRQTAAFRESRPHHRHDFLPLNDPLAEVDDFVGIFLVARHLERDAVAIPLYLSMIFSGN